MKIIIRKTYNNYCYYSYGANEWFYIQEQYDYKYKYLYFDKLVKWGIHFNNKKTEDWFTKTYIDNRWLVEIYNRSPEGYLYLKEHWGKGVFWLYVWYQDKQELKIVVNRVINVELKRIKNEN